MEQYTNSLPPGVYRCMIGDIGDGLSSVKGTPFISVKFNLVDDADKGIVRKYYTTDAAMSFFMDLYDAAMPPAEWDFPDNPNDPAAHADRLRNRIVWIHVESKEDQPNPEVTACRPDSETPPFFKPRKIKITRESATDAKARMNKDKDAQELDGIFGGPADAPAMGREPGSDDW